MHSTDFFAIYAICAACLGHARRVQTLSQSDRDIWKAIDYSNIASHSFVELASASRSSPSAASPTSRRQQGRGATSETRAKGAPPSAYIRPLHTTRAHKRSLLADASVTRAIEGEKYRSRIESKYEAEQQKALARKAKEVFDVLVQIADERSCVNMLIVQELQDLKDQLKALGQLKSLRSKLNAIKAASHEDGQLDYLALEDIIRWLGERVEESEVSWREMIENYSLQQQQHDVRCEPLDDQSLGRQLLDEYLAEVRNRKFAEISSERTTHQVKKTERAPVPSMFFDKLFMPREGPIDIAKKNFALPSHPNLTLINVDPPVYAVSGFMSKEECSELVNAADEGKFPAIPYGKKSQIFTGTKWAAAGTPVVKTFIQRTRELYGVSGKSNRFEPVTVTKYDKDQYQAKHLDSRLPHEINRNAAYLKTGGQRIAQVIVYLKSPNAGGTTRFFNPVFKDLDVKPEVGKALIFPTATSDGVADERYLHSAEPVESGSKYIVGTWLMESERSDAKDIEAAIKELWKIQKKTRK